MEPPTPDTTDAADAPDRPETADYSALAARVLEMCRTRRWGLHWTERGSYLHLEASELIEALRGKRGDPAEEAADVLLVLMSITEANGISWETVDERLRAKLARLETIPPYAGEERAA